MKKNDKATIMKEAMKEGYLFVCFLFSCSIIWLIVLIFRIFSKFGLRINFLQWIAIPCAIIAIFVEYIFKRKQPTSMFYKIYKRFACTFPFVIILYSLDNSLEITATMSYEQAKDLISIQWGIFAVNIALFIFWHKYKTNYLQKNIEVKEMKNDSDDELHSHIMSKIIARMALINQFLALGFLIVNFVSLTAFTDMVFFENHEMSDSFQVLFKCCFSLTITTLSWLLIDIIFPLIILRKELLDKSKISKEEFEQLEKINEKRDSIKSAKKDTNKSTEVDENIKTDSTLTSEKVDSKILENTDSNSNQQVEENKET